MQPKLKAKVRCTDREVGEVARVIVDPLSRQISHIVLSGDGAGSVERQIPMAEVQTLSGEAILLRASSSELGRFPVFTRDEYVTIHEVEIARLEEHLQVEPGEVLVPVPELERSFSRRALYTNLTRAIGVLLALPLVFPVLRYLMKPMYAPYDNRWVPVGNVNRIKTEDVGVQFRFKRARKEAFMPEVTIDKNIWIIRASPKALEAIYRGKAMKFLDHLGQVIWENAPSVPYVAFSGKCPHLGCAYKWRRVQKLGGAVFLCPCHLSYFDATGTVLGGPAPRRLDVLPIQVSENGDITVIDIEYKAGVKEQIRLV